LDDVEAGHRAGCRSVLVTGGETEWIGGPFRTPECIVNGFRSAVEVVLRAGDEQPERRCAL